MQAAGISAIRVAASGPRFGRESATGTRTIVVDATACVDAKSPLQRHAASRSILRSAHAHPTVIERLRERNGHAAAGLRIEFVAEK